MKKNIEKTATSREKVTLEGRLFDIAFWSFLTIIPLGSAGAILYFSSK
ncbi:hypothetical protein [Halobacteriovorax sp. HLS]|nr:hypothetical protein [Halobacteriovorax sp. HLS]